MASVGHYEEEAARALGTGTATWHADRTGGLLTIACKACGPVSVRLAKKFPPDVLPRKLQQAGWSNAGRRWTCGDCQDRARAQREETNVAEAERTAAAKKAHRAVIGWLEEAFDEAAGRFKDGFSDATIAAETGAAEEYVRKTREEFFGVLKEPSELAAIRDKIEALHEKADELIKDATAAAGVIRNDAGALKAELARLAKTNGWTV